MLPPMSITLSSAPDRSARDHATRDHSTRDHSTRDHSSREGASRRRSGPHTPVTAVLGVVVLAVLAVVGAWRLPGLFLHAGSDAPALPAVTTSFGVVTVAGHELLDGPSPEELGGVTHGIGGYVDSEHALMRVHLQLSGSGSVVPVSAFSLKLPDGTVLQPEMNTVPSELLPEGALEDASLSFVLPRGSGDYTFQVLDGSTTSGVPLGNVVAQPRPSSAHQH
jgi:hypothetical protein